MGEFNVPIFITLNQLKVYVELKVVDEDITESMGTDVLNREELNYTRY